MQRPLGVTILAILAVIAGLAWLGFGLLLAVLGVGFILILLGLVEFGVAYGFWTGASWGWWLGIIGAVLNILSIVSFDIVSFLIGFVMLYYLTRPHVKAWFRRM